MKIQKSLELWEYFKYEEKCILCMHLAVKLRNYYVKGNSFRAIYFYQKRAITTITLFRFKLKSRFFN